VGYYAEDRVKWRCLAERVEYIKLHIVASCTAMDQ